MPMAFSLLNKGMQQQIYRFSRSASWFCKEISRPLPHHSQKQGICIWLLGINLVIFQGHRAPLAYSTRDLSSTGDVKGQPIFRQQPYHRHLKDLFHWKHFVMIVYTFGRSRRQSSLRALICTPRQACCFLFKRLAQILLSAVPELSWCPDANGCAEKQNY